MCVVPLNFYGIFLAISIQNFKNFVFNLRVIKDFKNKSRKLLYNTTSHSPDCDANLKKNLNFSISSLRV